MPININGGSRSAGGWWSNHLQNAEKNERVEIIEFVGLTADNIPDAFREMKALSLATNCTNYFYQANINPRDDERLTPEQWHEAVATLEKNLGLTGQPHFVVEHEKEGRTHRHIIWSRIDTERGVAISDSLTAQIHERTSRELEIKFDLERGRSILVPNRDFERPQRRPKKPEMFRGEETGIDPRHLGDEVKALRERSDNGQSFKAGMLASGYILALGDRRDFVIIDQAGDVHSLPRRLGVKVAAVREFMKDVDPASLPSVDEAKERQALHRAAREARRMHGRAAAPITQGEANTRTDGPENAKQRRAGRPRKAGAEKNYSRRELGKTAGDIRTAWVITRHRGAECFAEEIEQRGVRLAIVSAAEAAESKQHAELARNFRQHGADPKQHDAGRYAALHETERPVAKQLRRFAPTVNEGEIVAVNGRGDVYRIDQRTTGDLRAEIDKRLGGIDRQNMPSVTDASASLRAASEAAWKEQRRIEWEKQRPATAIESKIADALRSTMTGHDFAEAIDKAGITITRTDAADLPALDALRRKDDLAAATGNEASGQRFAKNLEIGDFAAVTSRGNVFRLNPHKLDFAEIEQRLADTQRRMAGVVQARAGFEIKAELRAADQANRTAAWTARAEAVTAQRELRTTVITVDREARRALGTARRGTGKAIGKLARAGKGLFGAASAVFKGIESVLEGLFGAPEPPKTPQQKKRIEQATSRAFLAMRSEAQATAELRKIQEQDTRLAATLATSKTIGSGQQQQPDREIERDLR